jgi:hypothetical protein
MSTGDKVPSTRPNAGPNQRFDLVEFTAMAIAAQYHSEAMTRALLATPKASAGAATGERWSGSMTANPTSGSDGLFRLDTPVFVGVDANGGMLIKPDGTTLSVAVPAGGSNQQIYAYVSDVAEDTQVRRFLPATAPFTEFANAITTALRQTVGLFVRAGSLGTVVSEDTVAGRTRALLFLGVATNTGGVVAFTPGTNTLETVRVPATVPETDSGTTTVKTTVTGSQGTVRDLVNAALYSLGNAMWKGSLTLTPAAVNNYGAYEVPSGGVDAAYKAGLGYVTIGDGVTVFGDFNSSDYANSKELLEAAFAGLPSLGGTVHIKADVELSDFNGAAVELPVDKTIEICGSGRDTPDSAHLLFASGEFLLMNSPGRLTLRNLHIFWTDNAIQVNQSGCRIYDCIFQKIDDADNGAAVAGLGVVTDLDIQRCYFAVGLATETLNGMAVRLEDESHRIRISNCKILATGVDFSGFELRDVRQDVTIEDVIMTVNGTFTGGAGIPGVVNVDTTDNVTDVYGRYIKRIRCDDTYIAGVALNNLGNVDIEDVDGMRIPVYAGTYAGSGPVVIRRCRGRRLVLDGAFPNLRVSECVFTETSTRVGEAASAQGVILFERCQFLIGAFTGHAIRIAGSTISSVRVVECVFDNIHDAATNDFSCAQITAATRVDYVEFHDNTITNFQNVNWAGTDVTCRMFEVNTHYANSIACTNNKAGDVMRSSFGSSRSGAYLLEVNSADRSTVNAQVHNLRVSGNQLGTMTVVSQDYCMLLNVANFTVVARLVICDNQMVTWWAENAGVNPTISHLINLTTSGTCTLRQVTVSNNQIDVEPTTVMTALKFDVLRMTGGVSSKCDGFMLHDNAMYFTSGAPAFDAVNGWGINVTTPFVNHVVIKGNLVDRVSAVINNFFKTRFTGTVTNTLPAGGVPASSVAWAENINIASI